MRLPRRHPRSVYAVCDAQEALGEVDESAFGDLYLGEPVLADVAAPPAGGAEAELPASAAHPAGPPASAAGWPAHEAAAEWSASGARRAESGSPRGRRVLAGGAVFLTTAFILVASALVMLSGTGRPRLSGRPRLAHGAATRRTGAAATDRARVLSGGFRQGSRRPQALRSEAMSASDAVRQASAPPPGSTNVRLHRAAAGRRSARGLRSAEVATTLHLSPALGSIEPLSQIATCECSAADLEFGFER